MSSLQILVADDESELRAGIASQLSSRGFSIDQASDGEMAWSMIQNKAYDLVLLDVKMPRMSGLEVLKKTKEYRASTTVAIMTAHANLKDAVLAIHEGAFDYIEKPVKNEHLNQLIDKALEARELVEQVAFSRPQENLSVDFIGQAEPMQRIFKMVERLANVTTSVLIRGENGTGKELVARAIHFNSPRKHRPFVAVNCGAIPENLVESELFGHEKGAFTGAMQRKPGKFQYASGGTLFLDEIGDLPLAMQVKLLRVLQEQKITPVGSNREVKIDVRVIAATNRDLEDLMKKGLFRQDLFYRLNVMPVFLPPLKDRTEDISHLALHFIKKFNSKHGRSIHNIDPVALNKLSLYDWPGNIRELENAIEHAFVVESSDVIRAESLPEQILETVMDKEEGWRLPHFQKTPSSNDTTEFRAEVPLSLNYHQDKERFEKEFIIQALKSNQGRINHTCDKADIPKNTLLRKIKKYGIVPKDYE